MGLEIQNNKGRMQTNYWLGKETHLVLVVTAMDGDVADIVEDLGGGGGRWLRSTDWPSCRPSSRMAARARHRYFSK